jgi:hypothetical protein
MVHALKVAKVTDNGSFAVTLRMRRQQRFKAVISNSVPLSQQTKAGRRNPTWKA